MRLVHLLLVIISLLGIARGAAILEERGLSGAQRLTNAKKCHKHLLQLSLSKFCRAWLHGTTPLSGTTVTSIVTSTAPTQTVSVTETLTTVETTVTAVSPKSKRGQSLVPQKLAALHFPNNVITDGCLLLLYGTLSYPQQTKLITTTATPTVTTTVQTTATATYPDKFVVRLGTQYAILGASVYPVPSVRGAYQIQTLIDTGNTPETAHTGLVFNDYGQLPGTFGIFGGNSEYAILQSVPQEAYDASSTNKKIPCTLAPASQRLSSTGYRGSFSCTYQGWDTFANVNSGGYSILTTKEYCSSAAGMAEFPNGGCTNWDVVQWEADDYSSK